MIGRPASGSLSPFMRTVEKGILGLLICAAAVAGLLAAPPAPAAAPASPPPAQAPSDDATSTHRFTGVDRWVRIFDDPDRDAWQKPQEVVRALGLKPGMMVADLGAGTGYFLRHLAKAVAPGGVVLAIDPEAEMVAHMAGRVKKEGLDNTIPVLSLPEEPFLPAGRVDVVLIVDTFHHIDDRLDYFARMKRALAPGGRVAVIDFHKRPLPVGPPPEHKLAREFVLDEMKRGGWRLLDEKTFLPHQYFLIFAPGG